MEGEDVLGGRVSALVSLRYRGDLPFRCNQVM